MDLEIPPVCDQIKAEIKPEPEETEEVKPENEFAYTENTGFTSEIFKIEIRGLPKYYGMGELRKLLNTKLKLDICKIKLPKPGNPWAYVCFRSQEQRELGLKALDGYTWKGKQLTATEAKPAPDPLVKRRNQENYGDRLAKKRRTIAECTTPLAHLEYPDQLKQKSDEIETILKKLGEDFSRCDSSTKKLVEEQKEKYGGMPFEYLPIKASPEIDGYRNKCEFTVGKDMNDDSVVGFRLGSYANGFTEVGSVDGLKHIPEKMKKAVEVFQIFVRSNQKLEVFNPEHQTGHFKQLMARLSSDNGDLMLVVGINPQDLSESDLEEFKVQLVEFFSTGEGKGIEVASLYWQEMRKKDLTQKRDPVYHLMGKTHICDKILGLNFRISAESFFQVNTKAAEVLYSTAIELGKVTKETSVLDICCGTGTIGLSFAKYCKQVFGVEIIAEAVKDAAHNAELNQIENCKFFTGNSDDFIYTLMNQSGVKGSDVLAIVDPPRGGLHQKSIQQLRNAWGLNRLVYISCAPRLVSKNWLDLMRPCSKQMKGDPFVLKCATAVDLFPHTPHTELVLLFERESNTRTNV